MRELIHDSFYEMLEKYNRCIIDYCLIQDDTFYQGYRSHKDAILFAMSQMIERYADYELDEEPFSWSIDSEKAIGVQIDSASFLDVPENCGKLPHAFSGGQLPYWYAFLHTPHGTGYGKDDFNNINHVLFPNSSESLEVYEWTTDWSNYFDDGHEWWGAACWSIYDRSLNRFVVIMASTTD